MIEHQKKELKKLLDSYKLKLSVAESLTSGLIQANLGSISGSSSFYKGGITTYTIASKAKFLKVNEEHAMEVNAVSERVVREMAIGVSNIFESDIGLSTTGYAERSPDNKVEIPFAYIAVYVKSSDKLISKKVIGENLNRNEMRQFVANEVVNLLIDYLKS